MVTRQTSRLQVFSLVLIVLYTTTALAVTIRPIPTLHGAISEASRRGQLVTATAEELEQIRQLFCRTLSVPDPSDLADEWDKLDMQMQQIADPLDENTCIWVISESNHARHGRGIYAIRPNAKFRYALQMPHSFSDVDTRDIGLRLFQSSSIMAAAWNTIDRTQVDVAHVRFHYFNSFTTAFTDANPASVVIQLHGFAKHKRATPDAFAADCIVSNGTRNPPPWVCEMAQMLDTKFESYSTLLFPVQIDDLGATKNRQAKLIHGETTASFLHVEMSQPLRKALRDQSRLRNDFFTLILRHCRS